MEELVGLVELDWDEGGLHYLPEVVIPDLGIVDAIAASDFYEGEDLITARAVVLNAWLGTSTWLVMTSSRLYVVLSGASVVVRCGDIPRWSVSESGVSIQFCLNHYGSTAFVRFVPEGSAFVPTEELRTEIALRHMLTDLVATHAQALASANRKKLSLRQRCAV